MTDTQSSNTQCPDILVSAYQCGPGMGSVSQIGWEWYSRLAKRGKVTLVTHIRNRAALETAGPVGQGEVIYIDTEWFAGPLYRFAKRLFPRSEHPVFLISSLDFYVYDAMARRCLQRMMAHGRHWDVIHQPTPVSPLAATSLHRLGVPLIVGPWNGGLKSPLGFPEIMKAESGWLYSVRRFGRLLDVLLGCTKKAKVILTATSPTRDTLPQSAKPRARFMLENGVDVSTFAATPWPTSPGEQQPLKILFVGRLLPFKGVSMLIESLYRLQIFHAAELHIVGEGPEEVELKAQVKDLGMTTQVHFHGGMSHTEIAQLMPEMHVFCLPSVRESGGAVILEAMSSGRPVIALDYGGPSELVTRSVGQLIPAENWHQVVEALERTFLDVIHHPAEWALRGQAGRLKVESHYSWDAKIDQAITLYQEVRSPA